MDQQGLQQINLYSFIFVAIIGFLAFFSYTLITGPFYYALINPFTFIPLLVTILLIMTTHEITHYAVSRLFGLNARFSIRKRNPAIGITGKLSKSQFYTISLAPLVLISILLLIGLHISPHRFISYILLFGFVFNIIGSRSDISTTIYVQRYITHESIQLEELEKMFRNS